MELDILGQVIGGKTAEILIREKSGKKIELGDLLVAEEDDSKIILQVYDLAYGSQIPQIRRELMAGLSLEGFGSDLTFMEPELRNYGVATLKAIATIAENDVRLPKTLPNFFSSLRLINKEDLKFLEKPEDPVYIGKIRSGSKVLDVDVYLNGTDAFTHHLVIPATTGRGKSNLVKVMLWSILSLNKFGVLVLDPHDEYFGRYEKEKGLKDHSNAENNLIYYSSSPPSGAITLVINLRSIHPMHFQGIVSFTEAQNDAIKRYYNKFREEWIENIIKETEIEKVALRTLEVLQRRFDNILGVYLDDSGQLQCRTKVFSDVAGSTTTSDITNALEDGKMVIVDTSRLIDEAELLIGSIVVGEIFNRYQKYKSEGELDKKPVVCTVIEEAPRVLGKEVLENMGNNIYSTVAREGRKFRVGLIAITQLISLIPRQILANMNTKLILGNEISIERRAIIESAAQDLSTDD